MSNADTIRFSDNNKVVRVYFGRKRTGTIQPAVGGWQYIPKGSKKNAGEIMPTISAVKRSILD